MSNIQDLRQAAKNAREVLLKAKAIFPLDLFPDSITIDREKVTVVKRPFINLQEVNSIHIKDILNVEADAGPFLGSLKIWTRFFSSEPLEVKFLKRKDSLSIKQLLQGYIIATQKDIDCTDVEMKELVPMLRQLGGQSHL
jgi:hypothetical protein